MKAKQKTEKQLQIEVADFNSKYKVGDKIRLELDNGKIKDMTLKYGATILGGHSVVIWLNELYMCYSADRVRGKAKSNFYPDLKCPYCNEELEIHHESEWGYDEDEKFEQQCSECEKNFVYNVAIIFSYTPYKADCLNGGEHKLKMSTTFPREYTRMECEDCEYTRDLTKEEMETLLNTKPIL